MKSGRAIATYLRANLPIVLLIAGLVIIPFLFTGGADGVRAAKVLGLVLCATLVWAAVLAQQVRPSLGVAIAYCGLNAVWFGFGPIHATALVLVVLSSLLVWVAATYVPSHARPVLWAIALVGVVQACYGYLQMSGYEVFFDRRDLPDKWVPVGFLGQQTLLGPFLVASAAAAWVVCPWLVVLILPAILATGSSMTLASLLAAVGVIVLPRVLPYRALLGVLITLVLLGMGTLAVLGFPLLEDNGRLALWANIFEIAQRKPWGGFGLGTFAAIYPPEQPEALVHAHGYFLQAHNEYLQILFELGLVGVLIVVWLCADFARAGWKELNHAHARAFFAMGAALFVNAWGSFPFHIVPSAMLLLVAWGALQGWAIRRA